MSSMPRDSVLDGQSLQRRAPMPSPPISDLPSPLLDLARGVLAGALDDIAREARQAGREALFDAARPCLGGGTASAPPPGLSDSEFALALQRLRQRFRERVNRRLRAIEADASRRRILRRALYAACRLPRGSE